MFQEWPGGHIQRRNGTNTSRKTHPAPGGQRLRPAFSRPRRVQGALVGTGGTSRFPQTPSPGPLRRHALRASRFPRPLLWSAPGTGPPSELGEPPGSPRPPPLVRCGDRASFGTGGTSRFPQTPSTGPLRGQAASPPGKTLWTLWRTRARRLWMILRIRAEARAPGNGRCRCLPGGIAHGVAREAPRP